VEVRHRGRYGSTDSRNFFLGERSPAQVTTTDVEQF
jgi:hypothetical protein